MTDGHRDRPAAAGSPPESDDDDTRETLRALRRLVLSVGSDTTEATAHRGPILDAAIDADD